MVQHEQHLAIGSPAWLRLVPARWGLSQKEACRVIGIAPSTFRAKCSGRLQVTERVVGRIVDVELLLALGYPPFGWPIGKKRSVPAAIELSAHTLDHLRLLVERASPPPFPVLPVIFVPPPAASAL